MTLTWRTNALAERHRALGASLQEPWNGMPTAWSYDDDIDNGYIAVRTKAGLMDVSGLNIVHVVGSHAQWMLQRTITRDVRSIYPGKATYTAMLDDRGVLVDDGIVYCSAPNTYMVVHGSGRTLEQLNKEAVGRDVAVLFETDLQILSLQGPHSVEYLERHIPHIRELGSFRHIDTRLYGRPVKISRTGYTGEPYGYEIYCKAHDAVAIWDTILDEGADLGIIPVQFDTLDMFRAEIGLLFFPDDVSEAHPYEHDLPGDTLWELGLSFTVSSTNQEFRGIAQHQHRKGKERFRIYGVELDSDQPAQAGDRVFDTDGHDIGVVTCAMRSPLTQRSVALTRLTPDFARPDLAVRVEGASGHSAARTHPLSFENPAKRLTNFPADCQLLCR